MNLRTTETGEQTPSLVETTAEVPLVSNYPRNTQARSIIRAIHPFLGVLLLLGGTWYFGGMLGDMFEVYVGFRNGGYGYLLTAQLANIAVGLWMLKRYERFKAVVFAVLGLFQAVFVPVMLDWDRLNSEEFGEPGWPQHLSWIPVPTIFFLLALVQVLICVILICKSIRAGREAR